VVDEEPCLRAARRVLLVERLVTDAAVFDGGAIRVREAARHRGRPAINQSINQASKAARKPSDIEFHRESTEFR